MPIASSYVNGTEVNEFAETYEFFDGDVYSRFTTYQDPITYGGFQYKPAHIKRGTINRNTTFDQVTCEITAPLTDSLTKYVANYPVIPTKVTITRGLVTNFDAVNINVFTGVIKTVQIEDIYAVAQCISLGSILDATWPKDIHSSFCQNSLFDHRCGLAATEYMLNFMVESFTGKGGIVSSEIGATGSLYTGGYVAYMNDFRWITLGENNTFHLHVPFDSKVAVGTVLRAYQGCSKSAIDCRDKFNNLKNFYGCAYIPSDNPVLWGF